MLSSGVSSPNTKVKEVKAKDRDQGKDKEKISPKPSRTSHTELHAPYSQPAPYKREVGLLS